MPMANAEQFGSDLLANQQTHLSRGANLSIAYIKPSLPAAGRYDVSGWWCTPEINDLDRNLEVRIHAKAGEVYQWTYVDLTETI